MSSFQKLKSVRTFSKSPAVAPTVTEERRSTPPNDPITAAMDQAAADVPRLLTPKLVADMLGLTERTLERWRITGEGPRYVKLSRSTVRYLSDDVTDFVQASLRANTAQ